ncbi:sensor histidine kinase [Fulvivirga ulvae]|uniref:sensor histidine kinase n=1 Tax=Fulvivirga ulvae TaxID=2904245 RepID=UPI001F34C99D|nr:sensor histidine kinase [Fulvivirga ulvae]UII29590.1 sensor histidine kinase [Fulvivirga ulvae]
MKNSLLTIKIHIIGWCLLLLVPYLLTRQVYQSIAPVPAEISRIPLLVLSAVLITIFYFNYFLLIPRYLFKKKYWQYFSLLLLAILATFLFSGVVNSLSGFNPHKLADISPLIEKIQPVIKINALLMLVISIVTSTLLAVNNRLKETEGEKFTAQIASLKSQINPHFLFNTLNNIYATAIDTSPKAADMVDKLSEMMRYTMRETQKDFVLLEEEVCYISNYIELQKIRLDRRVKLDYTFNGNFSTYQLAPMLLIPFIENAFKHGVNAEQRSHIKIEIALKESELHLSVSNRKVEIQKETTEQSGLGIENTKRRLQLIYPLKYLLSITETEKDFSVSLRINLA